MGDAVLEDFRGKVKKTSLRGQLVTRFMPYLKAFKF